MRDYGTAEWEGGDAVCDHVADASKTMKQRGQKNRPSRESTKTKGYYADTCAKCGAKRIDSQIGLEESPEDYVTTLVAVFREARRVLRDDGTLWLNLGDSYATANSGYSGDQANKNLLGIPWRVAFALQADGWYLRSDIIWHKPNPMPESVTDRPTSAHEHIFLLAKNERYHFDAEAVREPLAVVGSRDVPVDRNIRNVWTVPTRPYKDAHFATFPKRLIRPCILAGCPRGGTVLDPFGGAGTTGIVANNLGCNAILIELNPEYVAMSKNRLRQVGGLFAPEIIVEQHEGVRSAACSS
jgi:site-specific DNA-methyltransferase (adenine-specific)